MTEEWKEVVAEWVENTAFTGRNVSGGSVQMGTIQGRPGISPMELLLLGVAGCTGMDVVSILEKKRQKVSRFKVTVRGKRAESPPRVYTEIEVIYHLWGEQVDPRAVEQAIQLSQDKYCSASAMLAATANIRTRYHIYGKEEELMSV